MGRADPTEPGLEQAAPSPDEVRAALRRVLSSQAFAGARRSAELLRYVVEAALKTPGRVIKEQELGAEALGRGDKFDPRFDPIARVEASRLRSRLAQYYAIEGANDPIQIDLPKGGYSPSFRRSPRTKPEAPAPSKPLIARWLIGVAVATAFVAGFLVNLLVQYARPAPVQPSAVFDAALGAPGVLSDQVGNSLALSPDGRMLAMHVLTPDGSTKLFVRKLDELEARELPGTIGGAGPFFSPDGQWIGFQAGDKIKKVRTDGSGSPIVLVVTPDSLGATWGDEGYILAPLGTRRAVSAVPQDGGDPAIILSEPPGGVDLAWPEALPSGRGLLYTVVDRRAGRLRIEAARMDGSGRRTIAASGTYPRYAAGHVFYVDRGTLFAAPFDVARLQRTGEPRPIVRDVAYRDGFGYAFYDVSDRGDLVYLRGSGGLSTIHWLDGGEASRPLLTTPNRYLFPRLSPDGRKLAFAVADGPVQSLRVLDIASGVMIKLGKGDVSETFPVWTPDSKHLFMQMDSNPALGWRNADGSGEAHPALPGVYIPRSMTTTGDRIAVHHLNDATHFDVETAPVLNGPDGPTVGKPEAFAATTAVETYPAFSPDGRWIAYGSNEAGDFEIYIRRFPDGGGKVKLSMAGGRVVAWSQTKQELFYSTNDHRIMVTPYSIKDGELVLGTPRQWSSHQLADTGVYYNFDLAPDGKSVVALLSASDSNRRPRDHITVRLNALGMLGDK